MRLSTKVRHKPTDDNVLVTLYESRLRKFMIIPIKDKTAASVMAAFKSLRSQYQEYFISTWYNAMLVKGLLDGTLLLAELLKHGDTGVWMGDGVDGELLI